jgi:hypothetical protein
MIPLVYVDIALMTTHGTEMADIAVGASVLMRSLHAVFTELPGRFALAIPRLNSDSPQRRLSIFRVFAEDRGHLDELIARLQQHDGMNRLFAARYPQQVPSGFSGNWISYQRLRIPSRRVANCRARIMRQIDEGGVSWVDMGSKQNGHRFRMYIKTDTAPGSASSGGKTNSYGLSLSESPFFLPDIQS